MSATVSDWLPEIGQQKTRRGWLSSHQIGQHSKSRRGWLYFGLVSLERKFSSTLHLPLQLPQAFLATATATATATQQLFAVSPSALYFPLCLQSVCYLFILLSQLYFILFYFFQLLSTQIVIIFGAFF